MREKRNHGCIGNLRPAVLHLAWRPEYESIAGVLAEHSLLVTSL